ncbi:hypothetical protein HDU67_009108, partial [Dinochytrium kinnereticum]
SSSAQGSANSIQVVYTSGHGALEHDLAVNPSEEGEEDIVGSQFGEVFAATQPALRERPVPPPPLPMRPTQASAGNSNSIPSDPPNLMDAEVDDIASLLISNQENATIENPLTISPGSSTKPPVLPYRPSEDDEAIRRAEIEEEDRKLALQLQLMEEEEAVEGKRQTRPRPASTASADTGGVLSIDRNNRSSMGSLGSLAPTPSTVEVLAAEIVNVREQIVAIDEALEKAMESGSTMGGSSKMKKLMDQKMTLMEQLSSLMDMVAEAEEAEILRGEGGAGEPLVPTISLYDLKIKVTDSNGLTANPNVVRKDMDRGLIFAVEVERMDGSAGWMLTHTYTDFHLAYDRLKDQFPKVSKSLFPSFSPLQKSKIASNPDSRAGLARDLQRWLLLMLSDPVLCGSRVLQDFMMPESVKRQLEARREQNPKQAGTTIRGQMFGVLKSAGRVVKKAAVSTGNVVGSVGGAALNTGISSINTIRRGITVDTAPKESSWEKKLEQRRASTSPQRSAPPPPPSLDLSGPAVARTPSIDSRSSGTDSLERGRSVNSRAPPPPPQSQTSKSISPTRAKEDDRKPPLAPYEIEAILECLFGTIEEIFRLSDPNQWIRQKGLHMVKSVLRRTHGSMIAEVIQDRLEEAKSTPAVAGYLKGATEGLWPNGVWHTKVASEKNEGEQSNQKLPRTEEEKSDTRIEAKHLLLRCSGLLGLDALETVIGRLQ